MNNKNVCAFVVLPTLIFIHPVVRNEDNLHDLLHEN